MNITVSTHASLVRLHVTGELDIATADDLRQALHRSPSPARPRSRSTSTRSASATLPASKLSTTPTARPAPQTSQLPHQRRCSLRAGSHSPGHDLVVVEETNLSLNRSGGAFTSRLPLFSSYAPNSPHRTTAVPPAPGRRSPGPGPPGPARAGRAVTGAGPPQPETGPGAVRDRDGRPGSRGTAHAVVGGGPARTARRSDGCWRPGPPRRTRGARPPRCPPRSAARRPRR